MADLINKKHTSFHDKNTKRGRQQAHSLYNNTTTAAATSNQSTHHKSDSILHRSLQRFRERSLSNLNLQQQ